MNIINNRNSKIQFWKILWIELIFYWIQPLYFLLCLTFYYYRQFYRHFLVLCWLWTLITFMRVSCVVLAIDAFTCLCTCNSCVKAFTIFFLTLRFFTDTSWTCFSWTLTFYLSFCLLNKLWVFMRIITSIASTFWSTLLASWKTLAVIF